jgi:hypothetical protein
VGVTLENSGDKKGKVVLMRVLKAYKAVEVKLHSFLSLAWM